MIREKISLLHKAVSILLLKKRRNKRLKGEERQIEKFRNRLREIKRTAEAKKSFPRIRASRKGIGYFLAGIVDAEGSMGWRKSGDRLKPYFCILMREKAIIDLFRDFFGFGSKYYRPAEKLFHFETAKRENVLKLSKFFLKDSPVKLFKNRKRLEGLQRILNDYTLRHLVV